MSSLLVVKIFVNCINNIGMDVRAKLVIKNTLYLYVRLFLTLIIGFITSRVILRVLGVEDFGIYSLVGGIVTLFIFVNQALSASTQRFITYDLGKKDENLLNKTFSMCMNAHLLFSFLILVVLEIAGYIFFSGILNIEDNRLDAAKWVFQCMVFSSILGIVRVPYLSLVTADEKFGFISFVGIIEPLLKLLILYILVIADCDKLILYSLLFLCVTLINSTFYILYCKLNYPKIILFKIDFKITKMKNFLKFSGMSLYEQIAVVCSYQGVEFLLNIYFGVVVNAAMGIAKQVQAAVFNFVSGLQSAMTPQITKSYAANDKDYLKKLMESVPRYSLYLIMVLSLPIIFNMESLLKLWLVDYPKYTGIFCQLILISCILESVSLPYRTLIYAEGRIVKYQLIIGSCFLLNIVCSFIFLFLGFQPEVVLFIRIVIYFFIDVIRVLFYRHYLEDNFFVYLKNTFGRVFVFLLIGLPFLILINSILSLHLFLKLISSFLILLTILYTVGVNANERKVLTDILKKKFVTK